MSTKRVFLMDDDEIQRAIESMRHRAGSHTPEERKLYDRLHNEKEGRQHYGHWTLGKRDPSRRDRGRNDPGV